MLKFLSWRGDRPLPTPTVTCPGCGQQRQTHWADDGRAQVLRLECPCGFSGRANTTRILDPRRMAEV